MKSGVGPMDTGGGCYFLYSKNIPRQPRTGRNGVIPAPHISYPVACPGRKHRSGAGSGPGRLVPDFVDLAHFHVNNVAMAHGSSITRAGA